MYNFFTAANAVFVKKNLQEKELGKWGVLYYNSFFMIIPLVLTSFFLKDTYELQEFIIEGKLSFIVIFFLILVSICGFILNYSYVTCTFYNSALTTICAGSLKNFFVTYIGMFSSGDYIFTWANFVGLNIGILGSILYTYVTFKPENKSSSEPIIVKQDTNKVKDQEGDTPSEVKVDKNKIQEEDSSSETKPSDVNNQRKNKLSETKMDEVKDPGRTIPAEIKDEKRNVPSGVKVNGAKDQEANTLSQVEVDEIKK